MTVSLPPGYPIRLSADRWMCAPPRSFSQLTTAFFASLLPGIHRKPFSRLTILLSAQVPRIPAPNLTGVFRKKLHKIKSVRILSPFPSRVPFGSFLKPVTLPVKDLNDTRGSNSLMEIRGFEPLTSSLQSWRSSQLSYIPVLLKVLPVANSNRELTSRPGKRAALSGVAPENLYGPGASNFTYTR